jgi:hypothetical protein
VRALLALVLLGVPADGASAQILGRVMDRETRSGVPDASVLLLTAGGEPVAQTLTDSLGNFWFIPTLDSATYTLQAVARGTVGSAVDPIEYRGNVARRIVILDTRSSLERPVPIDGLDVTVDPRSVVLDIFGFYDRKARGYGTFLEADDFAEAPTEKLTGIVRGLSGVVVLGEREILFWRPYGKNRGRGITGRARGLVPEAAPNWRERYCTPGIWVNGTPDWRLNDLVRDDSGFPRMAGGSVNDFLPEKDEILGIEVYRSVRSLPRELQIEAERLGGNVSGNCGVILIWTQ